MIQETVRCIEMVEIATDWMEGALDDVERATVEAHLAGCPDCTTYLDQLRTITRLAAQLPADGAEPARTDLKGRLLTAFRASRPS